MLCGYIYMTNTDAFMLIAKCVSSFIVRDAMRWNQKELKFNYEDACNETEMELFILGMECYNQGIFVCWLTILS